MTRAQIAQYNLAPRAKETETVLKHKNYVHADGKQMCNKKVKTRIRIVTHPSSTEYSKMKKSCLSWKNFQSRDLSPQICNPLLHKCRLIQLHDVSCSSVLMHICATITSFG